MKILGIDPGSRITGFGLIEANKLKFSYINSGCIRTQGDLNERIINPSNPIFYMYHMT